MSTFLRISWRFLAHPVTVAPAFLAVCGGLYAVERQMAHMPFVVLTILVISSLVFLFSARAAFSLYVAMALVSVTSLVSVVKYRTKGFDLHVYDLVFTGTDPEAINFLIAEFGMIIWPIAVLLAVGIFALALIWRGGDRSSLGWPKRAGLAGATLAALPFAYPLDSDEPRYFHYLGGFNASSFYISLLDLPLGVARGPSLAGHLEALPSPEPFPDEVACGDPASMPDVFFVLRESTANLENFPQLGVKPADLLRSHDGKMRDLYVETFAGGTWITNLSLLTGLSSTDFGWRAPYLTIAMEGNIQGSIPQTLARCGYRTAALLPMKYGFVNEGSFLESIGFETILDYDAIGASEYAHRDEFYYEMAERFIEKHRREDGRPLFLEIQTMFAHSPYDTARAPEILISGVPDTDSSEIREYVRRIRISEMDFRGFIERRETEGDASPSIVLEFSDHQSAVTKALVDQTGGGLADPRSAAYKTYYSVYGFGRSLDMRSFERDALDISFLGVSVLEAAGLPISPMFTELASLRDRCRGRFYTCADRTAVNAHLKRRVASGLLTLP